MAGNNQRDESLFEKETKFLCGVKMFFFLQIKKSN